MTEPLGTLTVIKGGVALDDRGTLRFVNDFSPLSTGVKRFYQVENHKAGFIRAWHGHLTGAKYVYCPKGAALVLATQYPAIGLLGEDIDDEYVTRVTLSASNPGVLVIPPSYYNGFKTLTDDAILLFFTTTTMEEDKTDDFRLNWDVFGEKIWQEDYR